MELVIMLLVPLPLGYFIRQRIVAYLVYIGVHSFVFTFQTLALLRAWTGGQDVAFPKDPSTPPWSYDPGPRTPQKPRASRKYAWFHRASAANRRVVVSASMMSNSVSAIAAKSASDSTSTAVLSTVW